MATPSDDSEDDDFVVIGTPVPEITDDQALQKPTTIHDLTARDKQGRRRFHGAFTGGFSAGYFNTVGSKEGFTPSTFLSSRNKKAENVERAAYRPEDFMDEEDLEEHGIAPRKFATAMGFTSEERKRKRISELQQVTSTSGLDITPALVDLIVPEQVPIGIQLLHKMGWREGQGLGPRKRKKKKKKVSKQPNLNIKMYGCAMPPSDSDQSDSDEFVPQSLEDIKFAPKDVCPISLDVKNDVHGLGYHGIDSSLALPESHINLFETPTAQFSKNKKGIRGEAFGVGVFEEEDENIYTLDSLSNYDVTMQLDEEVDNKFGWTAPRQHGKQQIPVTYVGKLLEGFCLSSKPLQPKKKYPPPNLPHSFKPLHWFRKKRALSHLPDNLRNEADHETPKKLTAVDRGILLGETPIMKSVFDLVQKNDMDRIEATKQAIAMTQSLKDTAKHQLSSKFQTGEISDNANNPRAWPTAQTEHPKGSHQSSFLSKFKPADSPVTKSEAKTPASNVPLFQGSLSFQPFRKDPAKQERYDKYLMHLKQGVKDPYAEVTSSNLTEWEKSREREEFAKASKIFRPMSAMMSSRFVRGAMIDDELEQGPSNSIQNVVNDQSKAAEMGMFGQLTHEVFEWHPNSLLCKRFNVPNPYPGSDVTGLPSVKRDKFSVFNFLNFNNDYQSQDATVEKESEPIPVEKTMKPEKKTTMASVFKVLDDPTFNKPTARINAVEDKKENTEASVSDSENTAEDEESKPPDMDLFRAIFKNSDSEDSSEDATADADKGISSSEDEKSEEKEEGEKVPVDDLKYSKRVVYGSEKQLHSSNKPMEVSDVSANINFAVCSRSPTLSKRKSRFSDLTDDEKDIINEGSKSTSVDTQKESVLSRLSVSNEDVDDEYGPKLPLDLNLNVSSRLPSGNGAVIPEVKLIPDRHSHIHMERHKHRKEKKKKSKHKKNKKHKKHKKKSSKMKKVKQEDSGTGDEADTESDSDSSKD